MLIDPGNAFKLLRRMTKVNSSMNLDGSPHKIAPSELPCIHNQSHLGFQSLVLPMAAACTGMMKKDD